jgi:hypothetical protein
MTFRTATLLLLLIAAAAPCVPAAARAQASPSQTVQALFEAMAARQWDSAAALVAPQSAERYQRDQLNLDGLSDPDAPALRLPDEENLTRDDSIALDLVPGLGRTAELAALSPARFLAVVLETWGGTLHFEEATAPGARTVLGEAVENDSVAHVVYRVSEAYPDHEQAIRVVRLYRVDGRWRVRVQRDLFLSFGVLDLHDAWKAREAQGDPPPADSVPGT